MSTTQLFAAEIVTTGTEILLGEIVDTNAAWIAQQLRDAGVNLYYKTTVGDNAGRLQGVLELGMTRSHAIIVTGGLGPTVDDITRQAVAAATGRELVLHEAALAGLVERFKRFGVVMTDNNRQQAMIPVGSELIPNPVGTAPGFIVETDSCAIIAIPGVPREMMRLMQDTVIPYLRERAGSHHVIRRLVLRTVGIGESAVDNLLGELMSSSNPTVGLAARTAQVDVRVTARADSAESADEMIETVAEIVRQRVGEYIYSETADEELESVVVALLRERGETLSVLESSTCGRLAQRVQAHDLAHNVLAQAISAPDGATAAAGGGGVAATGSGPDSAGALASARALRTASGSTYGLAVLGTFDPEGGVFGAKSGRTWIGLCREDLEATLELPYGGTDDYTVVRVVNQALSLLWQNLRNRQ